MSYRRVCQMNNVSYLSFSFTQTFANMTDINALFRNPTEVQLILLLSSFPVSYFLSPSLGGRGLR
jgi:hypothetical protein